VYWRYFISFVELFHRLPGDIPQVSWRYFIGFFEIFYVSWRYLKGFLEIFDVFSGGI